MEHQCAVCVNQGLCFYIQMNLKKTVFLRLTTNHISHVH
jgi:hypothetical protein